MGINLVTFAAQTVTPQDDALIYETALQESGMIYGGAVTIKSANVLHVAAGHGALCGRKFTIEETDVAVGLTPSGSLLGRIYIHMDLSDTGEPISIQTETANSLTPVIQQSDVNINNGVYEINLATFTVDTSTISNLVNVAPFIRDLDAREVIIAPVEPTNIASSNYAIGRRLILNKVLYRVTSAITAGQTITPGTNVTESNSVEEQIEANVSSINSINNNKLNQTVIATRQSNLVASKAYVIGEQFVYNNILYKATAAIAKNATITIGGNATTADSISTQISNFTNSPTLLETLTSTGTKTLSVAGYNKLHVTVYDSSGFGAHRIYSVDLSALETIIVPRNNTGNGYVTIEYSRITHVFKVNGIYAPSTGITYTIRVYGIPL